MGKFKDWLLGREPEPEPAPEPEVHYAPIPKAYTGPPIPPAQAAKIAATLTEDVDDDDDWDDWDDDPEPVEPDTVQPDELVPGWKRKGRAYNHFRTVKVVDRDGGYKFKVLGRSGKWRHKSDIYTQKNNAKRAAIAFVKKTAIPTRFTPDQYDGAVVYDTNAQDA